MSIAFNGEPAAPPPPRAPSRYAPLTEYNRPIARDELFVMARSAASSFP